MMSDQDAQDDSFTNESMLTEKIMPFKLWFTKPVKDNFTD
jgi:hypothetical protein